MARCPAINCPGPGCRAAETYRPSPVWHWANAESIGSRRRLINAAAARPRIFGFIGDSSAITLGVASLLLEHFVE